MRDLANERAEVCRKLRQFNLEPVNAEGLMPNGMDSWGRLVPEIESSDLFVLILGESYGWIPDSGPMASTGKAVTELEFDVARSTGIPVLVFMKRLDAAASTRTKDARRREAFRAAVGAWDGGWFRADFELANDLADKVGRAVVDCITNRFRAVELGKRRFAKRGPTLRPTTPVAEPTLPDDLVEAVADRTAVLLLGSGASLQAGLPSAAVFIDAMIARIRQVDMWYEPAASGTLFNAIASDFESVLGLEALSQLAKDLVDPSYLENTTDAHLAAVRLFDTVLTTNYDILLERARDGQDATIIPGEATAKELAAPFRIIKLHGSIAEPHSLVLTESDLANVETSRPKLWAELQQILSARPLLSVGSSLRDPSLVRLFEACRPKLRGWSVLPEVGLIEQVRLKRWSFQAIHGYADGALTALEQDVARLRAISC
jgi:hypothetical protein